MIDGLCLLLGLFEAAGAVESVQSFAGVSAFCLSVSKVRKFRKSRGCQQGLPGLKWSELQGFAPRAF